MHQRFRDHELDGPLLRAASDSSITERVDQPVVAAGEIARSRAPSHVREHTVERARDRLPADERTDGDAADAPGLERLADPGHGENGPDTERYGLLGARMIASAL